ncbi:GtrA family protein [Halorussus aquaticus]|uniref:GtrA family protein n=1 Tax=Halorussus aquaticus TaxID=2953748 RepID=A0ABD5Q2X1_9EURY|nr:GtrA family protein [Halorussus aquaticus]
MIEARRVVRSLLAGRRFGQFLSVGAFGAVVDNIVLASVVEMTTVPTLAAKVLSAETAIVIMFLINDSWTFDEYGRRSFGSLVRRFLKSNVVRTGGVGVAVLVLHVLHNVFGLWYLLANVAGIGVGFVVNYVFESIFTWRVEET